MSSEPALEVIRPDWDAPANVAAISTTRSGGVSGGPYAALNLGDHVGDDPAAVAENRRRLRVALRLPGEPAWLQQVHGTRLRLPGDGDACADACLADHPGGVCVVMTADCLPVLFCNAAGTRVAAAHAGWRGLLAGVLEQTLAGFDDPPREVLAWLGPAIGPRAFEVGDEVRGGFVAVHSADADAFLPSRPGHWLADIYALARRRLRSCGLERVHGGGWCTVSEPARFFSYRRDGASGRMASLVWLRD
jgi:YfiH family protein